MTLYEKVQNLCKKEGFEISNLGEITGIKVSKGSISKWKSGACPRAETVKAIAEYFHVTPESLTSDTDISVQSVQTVQDNHGVIGTTNAPVTIVNGSERKLSEQETELLNIFSKLSVVDQAKLIVQASELLKGVDIK